MTEQRYIRRPDYDRRMGRGDDFAGDAWEDITQTVQGDGWGAVTIVYTVVGYDPNNKTKGKSGVRPVRNGKAYLGVGMVGDSDSAGLERAVRNEGDV